MDPLYAMFAIVILAALYAVVSRRNQGEGNDLAAMFEGVMTQLTRYLQIQLQRRTREGGGKEWRPGFGKNLLEGRGHKSAVVADFIVELLSGKADHLTGRYFLPHQSLDEILERSDEILSRDLLTLRIRN